MSRLRSVLTDGVWPKALKPSGVAPPARRGARWTKEGLFVFLLAPLAALAMLSWLNAQPSVPVLLGGCGNDAQPEHVQLVVDESPSVVQVDGAGIRGIAITEIAQRLADRPCHEGEDLFTVTAFTESVVMTGPAPARDFAGYEVPGGGSTDITNALGQAATLAQTMPEHRHVVVLISDLEDSYSASVESLIKDLDPSIDVYVVDIRRHGVLGSPEDAVDTANDVTKAINKSRSDHE